MHSQHLQAAYLLPMAFTLILSITDVSLISDYVGYSQNGQSKQCRTPNKYLQSNVDNSTIYVIPNSEPTPPLKQFLHASPITNIKYTSFKSLCLSAYFNHTYIVRIKIQIQATHKKRPVNTYRPLLSIPFNQNNNAGIQTNDLIIIATPLK